MLQFTPRIVFDAARVPLAAGLLLSGCATAAPAPVSTTPSPEEVELDALRDAQEGRDERIQELESRLALAQAEAADLRTAARTDSPANGGATVRIGARRAAEDDDDDWVEPWEEGVWREPELVAEAPSAPEPQEETGPRPVLRLHGTPALPEWRGEPLPAAGNLPPIPTQVPLRLPVAGVASLAPPPMPNFLRAATPRRAASPDAAVASYRSALRHVRDRRFAEALAGFDAFLEAHPRHPYVQNALYWRGEVLYARRSYRRAKGAFEDVVRRFPRGSKVAEALLKVALCQARLGNNEGAERVLARLRRDYPDSVAARSSTSGGVTP